MRRGRQATSQTAQAVTTKCGKKKQRQEASQPVDDVVEHDVVHVVLHVEASKHYPAAVHQARDVVV